LTVVYTSNFSLTLIKNKVQSTQMKLRDIIKRIMFSHAQIEQ